MSKIIFKETDIKDLYIIEIEKHEDERGYFARAWCQKEFENVELCGNLVQCNLSHNKKRGTIRGLHFQKKPFSEIKLVRCVKGKIFDVAVDLREESETYGQWFGIELSEENGTALYIPEGCAHGYQVLVDDSIVFYQVSEYYTPNSESGILWSDEALNIQWPLNENVIISEKDQNLPKMKQLISKKIEI